MLKRQSSYQIIDQIDLLCCQTTPRSIILFAVRQSNRRQVRSKFTPDAIVLVDGSQVYDVDCDTGDGI